MRCLSIALAALACAGCTSEARAPEADAAAQPAGDGGLPVSGGEILTQRYDNARTGANLRETALTQANAGDLELLGSWPVDGEIYAQILIADGVDTGDGPRALALVATMNDSLYAFDADAAPDQALLWRIGAMHELGTPGMSQRNVKGPHGILSTPVIDAARGSVLLVARNCPGGASAPPMLCEHRLFRVALASGEIESSVVVEGYVVADGATVMFDPAAHWNRPGLLLAGDELYLAFGSGPHLCLGNHLTRLIGRIILEEMLVLLEKSKFELAPGFVWQCVNHLQEYGPEHLPVRVTR